jgi:hypothetical protein
MAGQFNIPGWDPTTFSSGIPKNIPTQVGRFDIPGWSPSTMQYRTVADVVKDVPEDVLKQVYDKLSGTNKYGTVKSVKEPKAILGEAIENFVKRQEVANKPEQVKAKPSAPKATTATKKSLDTILDELIGKTDKAYGKVGNTILKGGKSLGPAANTVTKGMNLLGRYTLPVQAVMTGVDMFGDKPKDEKIAALLALAGAGGATMFKDPRLALPSAALAAGAGTYPMWKDPVKAKLAELEANKQAAKAEATKPKNFKSNGIDLEAIDDQGVSGGTNKIDVLPPKTGLNGTSVGVNNNLQPIPQQATQAGVVQPQQQIPQQFIYETPAAKNEVLDFMEQFARQYPAMQEQDRRRQMKAALLAPVIQNDKFVDAALGQGQVATTAKQLELLNTAANARVSEAQKPLLAQAFAKAGLPAELAYASEEQLKQIVYSLVTNTNKESAKYKADMAAKLGVYKANQQLEGVRIATAAKQGPEKLIQVMGQAGYPMDEIEAMLGKVYGPYWRNMIGTGAPIQFNLGTGVVQGPEEPDFFNNN